jgi:putative ABC transport system permease protein
VALALAGGLTGLLLATALVRVIVLLGPASMPGLRDAQIDRRTAAFAVATSLLSALLAGALPALGVARIRLSAWLADRSAGFGPGAIRAQQALAVGQIGLAVALLVTAALLVESFRQLRSVDTGFRPADVTTAKVTLPASRYPGAAERTRFVDQVLERAGQLSGVTAIGMIDAVPMADNRQGTGFTRLHGPPADATASPNANVAWITEGYFEAIGVPLSAGRTFTPRDTVGSPPVVIVNRRLARQAFGEVDPIGRLVRIGISAQRSFEIVGVVGDERHGGVETEATPSFFVPYRQLPSGRDLAVIVRVQTSSAEPSSTLRSLFGPLAGPVSEAINRESTVARLRSAIKNIDPGLPLFQVRTMEQVVDAAVATPRSMAWLLSVFAMAAMLLAAIGVFGVMSHAVSQRTREIGVRMAIGASPYRMLRAILGEGLIQVGLGLVLGVALSLLTSRLLAGLLFGVTAASMAPYVIVAAVLALVSLVACLVPARRAMQVDPALALRSE